MAEDIKNQEILYLYDAKLCNPNGDPDDENKPRMDWETQTNLVSDVRLKRYIRDYLASNGELIFVSNLDGQTVDATERIKAHYLKKIKKIENPSRKDIENVKDKELEKSLKKGALDLRDFIDVRLFGVTAPIKAKNGKGISVTYTGPVQFSWGYSLNRVSLNSSSTITSTFRGRDTKSDESYGSMGKDYRVNYSLISFHGQVSALRANETNLTQKDIELLDDSLEKAIPLMATTRSKMGQKPRMILKIVYNNSETFLGDLRKHIELKKVKNGPKLDEIRDTKDYLIDMTKVGEILNENREVIESVAYWKDDEINVEGDKKLIEFENG